MIISLIFIGLIYFSNYEFVESISCTDGSTRNAADKDFIVVYRPPLFSSKGYFYKTNGETQEGWNFINSRLFSNSNSIIQSILKRIRNDQTQRSNEGHKTQYSYLSYNDVINDAEIITFNLGPKKTTKKNGPGKGILIWDDKSAIWILHSVPEFPFFSNHYDRRSSLSRTELNDAHFFLCLTIQLNDITTIMNHLIISKAQMYDVHFAFKEDETKLIKAQNTFYDKSIINSRIHYISQGKVAGYRRPEKLSSLRNYKPGKLKKKTGSIKRNSVNSLVTIGNQNFVIITYSPKEKRHGLWNKVAKTLKTNKIFIKSSSCVNNNPDDILFIKIDDANWDYKSDKSIWGISENINKNEYWFCIADVERNSKNIGTAVCLINQQLHSALKSIVQEQAC